MAKITVNAQDVKNADRFLTTYLSDQIPEADFSEGSVVRDFVVKAVAYMFAYLQKEVRTVRDRQSLQSIEKMGEDTDEDADAAVDEILSNWFISRLRGAPARLPSVLLHFSRATDVSLTPSTRFFRTADTVFTPVSQTVISSYELRPVVGSDGVISSYTVLVPLVAAEGGTAYNVPPGRFVAVDAFNPFFMFAENTVAGQDGRNIETTQELIKRAPTAASVRNLVNERSINTVLRQNHPTVTAVTVIGFGDPEMTRDRVPEGPGHLRLNVGGHTDIFISTPRTSVTETLDIGAFFARPDGLVTILRDPAGFAGVAAGDVVRVTSGLDVGAREFAIAAVGADFIEVQTRFPFPQSTDEGGAVNYVTYAIGNYGPGYDNIIPLRSTGVLSRKLRAPGSVVLTGQPVYRFRRVEVVGGSGDVLELEQRVNGTPGAGQFQVVCLNPPASQSALAVTQVNVDPAYTGQLRVTYDTLVDYTPVQVAVNDRFERVVSANTLVRAKHPLYLEVGFRYRLGAGALGLAPEGAVAKAVADYINSYDGNDKLDLSSLRSHIRQEFPAIGVIFEPFDVRYRLLAPDGQVYHFTTKDLVSVQPSWPDNTVRLLNGASLRAPILGADIDASLSPSNAVLAVAAHSLVHQQLLQLGVSDRTTRYVASVADIQPVLES